MNLEIVTIFLTLASSKASLNIWFQLTSIRIIFRDYLTVVWLSMKYRRQAPLLAQKFKLKGLLW